MRVIAGIHRSRLLQAPRGVATRPTSDRLRETLFNVLGGRVHGACFADLYAGSGAVGIEALSRGASTVYFVEKAPSALLAIRGNLRSLGVVSHAEVVADSTAALLRRLDAKKPAAAENSEKTTSGQGTTATAGVLDIVFLDPPYEAAEEYRSTLSTLGTGALLRPEALVVAEHARRAPLPEAFGVLRLTRTLLQGDAALSFYAVPQGDS